MIHSAAVTKISADKTESLFGSIILYILKIAISKQKSSIIIFKKVANTPLFITVGHLFMTEAI